MEKTALSRRTAVSWSVGVLVLLCMITLFPFGNYFGIAGECHLQKTRVRHPPVNQGTTVTIEMTIENELAEPVTLIAYKTTCGCTKLTFQGQLPQLPLTIPARTILPLLVHVDTLGRSGLQVVYVYVACKDIHGRQFMLTFQAEVDCLPGPSVLVSEIELETHGSSLTKNTASVLVGSAQLEGFVLDSVTVSDPSLLTATYSECDNQGLVVDHRPHDQWKPKYRVDLEARETISCASKRAYLRLWVHGEEKPLEVLVRLKNSSILAATPETLWLSHGVKTYFIRIRSVPAGAQVDIAFDGVEGRVLREFSNGGSDRIFSVELKKPESKNLTSFVVASVSSDSGGTSKVAIPCLFEATE